MLFMIVFHDCFSSHFSLKTDVQFDSFTMTVDYV